MNTSILFPAFANEYSGMEEQAVSDYSNDFREYLRKASKILDIDLENFDFKKNNLLNDELLSQYISYIFSCTVADILKRRKIRPLFVSGYSMGLYPALYYVEAVSFYDGLLLIKKAWEIISRVTAGGKFGMGMIIGLEETDVHKMINNSIEVEICNQNNAYTFVISGKSEPIDRILDSAKEEGALKAYRLTVSKPYHSVFLDSTFGVFSGYVSSISFLDPQYCYISAIDQGKIETTEGLKNEVIRNLYCRMNWYRTMRFMAEKGTDCFFECGAGDGLTRNLRFVEGDFKSFPVHKIDNFFELAG